MGIDGASDKKAGLVDVSDGHITFLSAIGNQTLQRISESWLMRPHPEDFVKLWENSHCQSFTLTICAN